MINKEYLHYTYMHRKAFEFVVQKLVKDEMQKEELFRRGEKHDLDKAFLYTMIDKSVASKYHRETQEHHLKNNQNARYFDKFEAIIDFECAGYTKADKPLNAYDTVLKLGLDKDEEIMEILQYLNIAKSYKNVPTDNEWVEYRKNIPAPTDENILKEIHWYVLTYPKEAAKVYDFACDWLSNNELLERYLNS